MSRRLLVLGWHNIDPTPAFPAPSEAGRRGFVGQLRLLSRLANVISLRDALDRLRAGERLPPRAAALTFDDGYRDQLELAVPALARFGLPATFFLVPGFLSGQIRAWWEDLAWAFERTAVPELVWDARRYDLHRPEQRRAAHDTLLPFLKRLDRRARDEAIEELVTLLGASGQTPGHRLFLDWNGARQLVAAGHDVGSHSLTHAILAREDEETQAAELHDSRSRLEAGLGRTVDVFAYPNGTANDYSNATIRAARKAGYRCAVTTRSGLATARHCVYEVRRFVISPDIDLARALRDLRWAAQDALHAQWSARREEERS
jgi:peptidoglycan/xylan/chitin deacetylase (PgdA/CDA1 family)